MIIRNDMEASYVRVFHASPDAPAVDIYVNGSLVFQNLSFKSFSAYVQLPMGKYKVTVYPANQNTNPVLTQTIEVPQEEVITVAAAGNLENLQLVPYIEEDANDLEENESKLRFIHLSPGAPGIDIIIDGNLFFEDVAFLDSTDYKEIQSKTHNVSINVANTQDSVLAFPLTLKSQKVYTVYIVGDLSNISTVQSLDGSTFVRF